MATTIAPPRPVYNALSERDRLRKLLAKARADLAKYVPTYRLRLRNADGTEETLYSAQPVQDKLHASPKRHILIGGAAGGSKSRGLREDARLKCLRVPGLRVLFLRRTYGELEKTHILDVQQWPAVLGKYVGDKHRYTFTNESFIQFGHCKDIASLKQYLSTEWDVIYIDEASTFLPRMLDLLDSRLRTTNPVISPQLILASNPGGEAHVWLMQRFIERVVPDNDGALYDPEEWHFIPAKVTDNAYIQDDYVDRLLALPEAERNAYLYGKWSAFAGQFFREWAEVTHASADPRVELPEWMERQGGMDWGYDPDPFVVLVAAFDNFGRPTVYGEISGTLMTPYEVADAINSKFPEGRLNGFIIHGDPSMFRKEGAAGGVTIGDQINERLFAIGSQIVIVGANNDRKNGWMRVHTFLDPRRQRPDRPGSAPYLTVIKERSGTEWGAPGLISAIPAQRHDERPTKQGDMAPSSTDHWLDAIRYMLMAREPLALIPFGGVAPASQQEQLTKGLQDKMKAMLARAQKIKDAGDGEPMDLGPAVDMNSPDLIGGRGGGLRGLLDAEGDDDPMTNDNIRDFYR